MFWNPIAGDGVVTGMVRPTDEGRMVTTRRVFRPSVVFVVCVLLAVLASGCTDGNQPVASRDTDPSSATASAPPSATPVECDGDDELNEDDDGAVEALLQSSQLPSGDWTTATRPPCPWAFSADELLDVPVCFEAATTANAPATYESRNGNARATFARAGDMQLDDRIEIYTSRQNVDAIRAILAGPSMPACFMAALQQRADTERTTVGNVTVDSVVVQPDAAALGLGFPAVAGYAADEGFVYGVNITFTETTDTSSEPVAMRVVTFGGGAAMSTITLIGATPAELDGIDLTDTLSAAATNYKAMFGPSE